MISENVYTHYPPQGGLLEILAAGGGEGLKSSSFQTNMNQNWDFQIDEGLKAKSCNLLEGVWIFLSKTTQCKSYGIHSKNHWSICLIWCNVFPSKGCDVRVLEKSPGEYYTRDEIEQVKIYFSLLLIFRFLHDPDPNWLHYSHSIIRVAYSESTVT